jgi:hypothetical protein
MPQVDRSSARLTFESKARKLEKRPPSLSVAVMLIITLHRSSCPLISYSSLENLTRSAKSDNGSNMISSAYDASCPVSPFGLLDVRAED